MVYGAVEIPVSTIVYRAIQTMLQIFVISSVGVILTRKQILDAKGKTMLSTLALKVFLPCFYVTKVLRCPDNERECVPLTQVICEAWPFLFLPILWVLLGLIVGKLTAIVGRTPVHLRKTAVATCTFGNHGGMPTVLLDALTAAKLAGNSEELMEPLYFNRLALYGAVYPVMLWSVGTLLLSSTAEPELMRASSEASIRDVEKAEAPQKRKTRCCVLLRWLPDLWRAFLTPPVIATVIAIVIGLINPVRDLFVDMDNVQANSFCEFIFAAVTKLGGAAVPTNMIIVGSNLANVPKNCTIPWWSTMSIVLSKMVIIPGIAFGGLYCFGAPVISAWSTDPTIVHSAVLVSIVVLATPTANAMATMAEQSAGEEGKQALTMWTFVQYCVAPATLTWWFVVVFTFFPPQ